MSLNSLRLSRLLPLVVLLFCAACTPKTIKPQVGGGSQEQAQQTWQRFEAQATAAEGMTGPFRINANLRYSGTDGANTRVSCLLWGNGNVDSPYPLRLDLMAGIGSVVAKAREDNDHLIVYVPNEKTAYVQEQADRTLASFGVPIPLSLSDLTLMLTGRSGALFLPKQTATGATTPELISTGNGNAAFVVNTAQLPGILELSPAGSPLVWAEHRSPGWSIVFEADELTPLQPRRLRISHPQGYSALIVVKDISRVSPPYSSEKMALSLPAGTTKKKLSDD